jgi:asparagine synthase (glutamine-hydrolysing)
MCGIAGIFRRQRFDARDPSRLRAMTDVITHRGPDDAGYLQLDSRDGAFQIGQSGFEPRPCDVCLGNRRLSIIDLSSNGRQPIANETGDIFAVFNGEILDYVELREQLTALGHVFRSQTDTEVVVHAYEQWGADCVKRFNGMWAFAIWDQRRRELFCSRDRFGIKPFYYHLDDDVFVFASEVKGILPALEARPRPDYAVVREFLMDGTSCRTSDTFFEGIKRLEPSHNLFVFARGVRTDRYWDYHTSSGAYDHRQPVETFRNLLDDAVRLRLRSDVPVGIALSGGLDSTSILACAARGRKDHGLKAFTAVFPGERFDEHKHALVASRELGAELFCVEYRPEHFTEDLQRVTWFLDYPAPEGQVLLRWRLMELASRHVKVVLEGQGADEMLAGYPWRYSKPWELDQLDRLGRLPSTRDVGKDESLHGRFRGRPARSSRSASGSRIR